ncbi:MAG: hypothetical protein H0U64_01195 [Gemmatimonadaceae bacterium]|nr:hypothetical protein [Gemmatimonadaceae bacterium]
MIASLTVKASMLLQAAVNVGDTVLMKQVQTDPATFEKVTSIASLVMTVTIIILTGALVPAAWNFRKSYAKISDLLDRIYNDVNPLMRHASTIADNVNYITTSVRVDVQQLSQTVAAANQRMMQAVNATEARIKELNALLEVVQEEAESVFVTTASTLRGVKTGLNTVFDNEDLEDGDYDYIETDDDEKPRPKIRSRG